MVQHLSCTDDSISFFGVFLSDLNPIRSLSFCAHGGLMGVGNLLVGGFGELRLQIHSAMITSIQLSSVSLCASFFRVFVNQKIGHFEFIPGRKRYENGL